MRLVADWAAAAYGLGMRARAHAYRQGLLQRRRLPKPTVSVGNLTVGGTGKTPVASWIAGYFAAKGLRPGVLLRGGRWGDEAVVHGLLQPAAVVVTGANRHAGAAAAVKLGADVLILDDGFQRLDVDRDVNILLVSAESFIAPRLLPAGPWREGLDAITRASVVVVTRKCASAGVARTVARQLEGVTAGAPIAFAHLRLTGYRPMRGGGSMAPDAVAGRTVLMSAGVAAPEALAVQLEQQGARVVRLPWPDHHRYTPRDASRIAAAASTTDHVIVTEKDAVKLREIWPQGARDPLVAQLEVLWEDGAATLRSALDRCRDVVTPTPPISNDTTYE